MSMAGDYNSSVLERCARRSSADEIKVQCGGSWLRIYEDEVERWRR